MNPLGPPRAVLDTSALVPGSGRRVLQQASQDGSYIAIWSPWIIGELYRVLTWHWVERTRDFSATNYAACGSSAKAMMALLIVTFETISPIPPYPPAWPSLTDIDDYPIWAAAKMGQAHFVVSENTRDFPPRGPEGRHLHEGIEYLTTRAFLDRLTQDST